MKKLLISLAILAVPTLSFGAVTYPVNGGTGTSTIPMFGQVLVGQPNGTYAPQATSTLGLFPGINLPGCQSTNPCSASYFIATSTATATPNLFPNLEGVLHPNDFSGGDVGAQIQAAYNAASSTGANLSITTPGYYLMTTPVNFTTANKPASLTCGPGVILAWNGTTTTTNIFTYNIGTPILAGYGIHNCTIVSSNLNSDAWQNVTAIYVGGTQGGPGALIDNNYIRGLGTALHINNNTFLVNVTKNVFIFNTVNMIFDGTTNADEEMRVTYNTFADSVNRTVAGYFQDYCVQFQVSGVTDYDVEGNSFDDCQRYYNLYGGTGNIIHEIANHSEDPATPDINHGPYSFVLGLANQRYDTLDETNDSYVQDYNTGTYGGFSYTQPSQDIMWGGLIQLTGDSAQDNSASGAEPSPASHARTDFVSFFDATNVDSVSWAGFSNRNNGVVNIYGINTAGTATGAAVGMASSSPFGYGTGGGIGFYETEASTTAANAVNFGINTATPGSALEVNGNIDTEYGNYFGVAPNTSWPSGTHALIGVNYTNSLDTTQIYTPGSVRSTPAINVYSNADTVIGTSTSPSANLEVVANSANATTSLQVGSSGQNKGSCLVMYDQAGTTEYVSIQAGAFKISTTSCQ